MVKPKLAALLYEEFQLGADPHPSFQSPLKERLWDPCLRSLIYLMEGVLRRISAQNPSTGPFTHVEKNSLGTR